MSRQSAHEGGKVVSSTHRPPLPQEIVLVVTSDRGRVDPRATVRPEGLCQWKISMVPSEIEPATFRLVTQDLKNCAIMFSPCSTNKLNFVDRCNYPVVEDYVSWRFKPSGMWRHIDWLGVTFRHYMTSQKTKFYERSSERLKSRVMSVEMQYSYCIKQAV